MRCSEIHTNAVFNLRTRDGELSKINRIRIIIFTRAWKFRGETHIFLFLFFLSFRRLTEFRFHRAVVLYFRKPIETVNNLIRRRTDVAYNANVLVIQMFPNNEYTSCEYVFGRSVNIFKTIYLFSLKEIYVSWHYELIYNKLSLCWTSRRIRDFEISNFINHLKKMNNCKSKNNLILINNNV